MEEKERAFILVGLGNPGKKYDLTRHNMGFLALKVLAHLKGWVFKEEKRFHAHVAQGKIDGRDIVLLLPDTYMNESGRAVQAYLAYYKLGYQNVLVVSDDIHIDFGALRFRKEGSPGGHNGLKSVEAHLGTHQYARLRIGIGKGKAEEPLVDYVLDAFSQEELAELPKVLERAVALLEKIIKSPPDGVGEQKHESK